MANPNAILVMALAELNDAAVPDSLKELLIDKVACEAKVQLLRNKRALRPSDAARLRALERKLCALDEAVERQRVEFHAAKRECEAFLARFDRAPVTLE